MNIKESTISHGIQDVRRYGIAVLIVLFLLNVITLGALHWVESNQLHNELAKYMETIPSPSATSTTQTIRLPEDVLSFQLRSSDRTGFYETSLGTGKDRQDYLAYADPNKHYVLMKSEKAIQEETKGFGITLLALYAGEVILLLGWWFFVRAKIREIFDID
ncbi:MAG: hypothetical protein A3B07_02085 [Candidatus Yonathbacteria bacterium RIFCSPLOWO2_01_FULL_43_27]|uniref:Uncharacterized protein n=2 Tax=Parcubacteria group TaxID=1794811 RepID=A0A1G2SBA9_9BACT|nr:MAG: hypothetical protein UW78_C0001G0022 [Candidatus Azambacteria bacterium GW2011_GWA1_44_9]OHA78566.1 MAG: hypothetical protein A2658_02140 [Candidatus Yonathbacteria bacterium RIFCSPHIGHO2_01_FULL_44_19]OHA82304.1 MAG: hypothetical protein A3B07_02085 [Candidatus Yonathbacteria bacterium RIFCSPLOWO2_01_FULL_43_27]